MTGSFVLSYFDLALAASLLVFNAGLSIVFGLNLERRMIWAAVRMVVQLLLVGLILHVLFNHNSLWLTVAIAIFMGLFAGREILVRQEYRLVGWWG